MVLPQRVPCPVAPGLVVETCAGGRPANATLAAGTDVVAGPGAPADGADPSADLARVTSAVYGEDWGPSMRLPSATEKAEDLGSTCTRTGDQV